jgi:hypothetical protein
LALLDKQPPSDLTTNFERISIALDQGQWDQAKRTAATTAEQAKTVDPLLADLFAVVDLSVRTLAMHDAVPADHFRGAINTILANVDAAGTAYAADRLYFALAVAYMAQRSGHAGAVSSMLPNLAERVHAMGDPRAEEMLVIVEAGQLRLAGNADKAIPQLQELIDGHELYQAHVALRDALIAAGRNREALREDQWLATHRGRAYAEVAGGYSLQSLNVADTTLSRLNAAEIYKRMGRDAEARREAQSISGAWWEVEIPDYFRPRLETTFPASNQ